MRNFFHAAVAVGLVGLGYLLGASGLLSPESLRAQAVPAEAGAEAKPEIPHLAGISDETRDKVKSANDAVKAAITALQDDNRYVPVTNTVNSFAATVGGINVLADLEAERGVDPETFAALYAGLVSDAIARDLGKDDEGRVTYKGKVVRMYPISRLRELFQAREQLAHQ